MARQEKGSGTYNQRSPESVFSAQRAKADEQTCQVHLLSLRLSQHPPSPPASGGRMGSALKSPLGGKEQSCAFVLARSVSPTPRVLSLPPPSSDTGSQSARYVPAARERCESGARPGPLRCRLPASLQHGAATRLELAAASAVGCGGV